jgi:hypothetical protein
LTYLPVHFLSVAAATTSTSAITIDQFPLLPGLAGIKMSEKPDL